MMADVSIAAAAPVTTARPTPLAERTLVAALAALCALALIFAGMLTLPIWTGPVAAERVHYIGAALIVAVVGILVLIIAFASPWLGSVRMSGMGAHIEVDGDRANG